MILNVDFAPKLGNYTTLKFFICLKWIIKNFSTTLHYQFNYILCRSLPLKDLDFLWQYFVSFHFKRESAIRFFNNLCVFYFLRQCNWLKKIMKSHKFNPEWWLILLSLLFLIWFQVKYNLWVLQEFFIIQGITCIFTMSFFNNFCWN